jgi:hypothetical protein
VNQTKKFADGNSADWSDQREHLLLDSIRRDVQAMAMATRASPVLLAELLFASCINGGPKDPPFAAPGSRLAALLRFVVPLHFGLLTVGLRLRRIHGERWSGERNRKAKGRQLSKLASPLVPPPYP